MRIELAGRGFPIPDLALPEPLISGDRPTQVLIFEDGEVFNKADWINLGYTNYEVWCVGGSGGRGGVSASEGLTFMTGGPTAAGFVFPTAHTREPAPAGPWALVHERGYIWALDMNPPKNYYTDYYIFADTVYTGYEWTEHNNPTHLLTKETYLTPFLMNHGNPAGGAGGGGGVHVISGELDDLPDSVPIVVGAAGADAPPGQGQINGPYTPEPWVPYPVDMGRPADYSSWDSRWYRSQQITNLLAPYEHYYPLPHPSFLPPQPGGDGGASTFGGDICQASGGKGGNPAKKWMGSSLVLDGIGGAGGIGGRTLAGGGGAGSISNTVPGSDGSWNGVIGSGGGGGRGGRTTTVSGGPPYYQSVTTVIPGSNGGRGAFSYGDTSVYGQRQYAFAFVGVNRQYDYDTGELISETPVPSPYLTMPGGGGGVRANYKRLVGSDAQGYSPDGMVLLRLMKLE